MFKDKVVAYVPHGKRHSFTFIKLGCLERGVRVGNSTIMDITVTLMNKYRAIIMIDFFKDGFSDFKEFECIYKLTKVDVDTNLLVMQRVPRNGHGNP